MEIIWFGKCLHRVVFCFLSSLHRLDSHRIDSASDRKGTADRMCVQDDIFHSYFASYVQEFSCPTFRVLYSQEDLSIFK